MDDDGFVRCGKCGKKIIKRLSDGRLEFKFGRCISGGVVVYMAVSGIVEINCLRANCNHLTTVASNESKIKQEEPS